MTREEILAMEGQELSEVMIREVFKIKIIPEGTVFWNKKEAPFPFVMWNGGKEGWCLYQDEEGDAWSYRRFNPSEDISAAWEVLSRFPLSTMERVEVFEGNIAVHITLWPSTNSTYSATASARTFELAVCRAALLAVMNL